jgi:dipeptidyl-peptidase-4
MPSFSDSNNPFIQFREKELIMKKYSANVLLIALLLAVPLTAQVPDSSLLDLKRLFTDGEFRTDRFGPARWIDEGDGYTTLEPSESEPRGRDIIRYTTDTEKREVLVPASRLIPPGSDRPLRIANYIWSAGQSRLLIFTNTHRVWRQNTRGDYWVLDMASGNLKQLGGEARPSSLMFATFSPDGERVAYVRENDLYVENLNDHNIIRLTRDGSETLINGTFDWVYEEEFGLRNGFRWSPDGRSIAYWQLDASGVGTFYLINNTDSLYARCIPIQYPKVGTTNSACRVGVVSAEGGETVWMKLEGDPRNNYIARMEWADNSREIVFQYLNRLQNTNRVILGNAETGKVRTVFTDTDRAWVSVVDDWIWLDGGREFTWVSENDGWRHIYRISRDGQSKRKITTGDHDVIRIAHIDRKGKWIYFIASPDNPTQRYLFRKPLSGKGRPQRLTPLDQPGTHSYQISPDARWAIHTGSSMESPPRIELVALPEHRVVRSLADNARLRKILDGLRPCLSEFFRVEVEKDVLLDGWIMKPYDFDPSLRYPVLFYVYGEPAGQTVLDRWGGTTYLWHRMLTQKGYVVISVDNRGTPAPRGRDWRKCIYRQIGILASRDQAEAVRAISQWPFVDSTRIAVWGWSGGGSMSLNAIFRYPGLYQTAMSVAPVPDQHLYDTIYQERYMGLPGDNKEGFKLGSPITYAHQLRGNLLVVHGTGDDNVHFQGTERLVNELIRHNKTFTMMAYPNRSHGIYERENTSRHLRELLTRYLLDHTPPGGISR